MALNFEEKKQDGGFFLRSDVRETPSSTQTQTQTNLAPIGAILPWLKTFTNTPVLIDGWVQCDGQVLSDGDSIYNGQTIPDLNGDNAFLRGNSTSGATGGSETMAHTHTGTASGTTGAGSGHTHDVSGTTGEESSHTHLIGGASDVGLGGNSFRVTTLTVGSGTAHSHSFSDTSTSESSHTHSFSDGFTTSAASNDENRPPFHNVVWIMRVK